jgi:copper chaperone
MATESPIELTVPGMSCGHCQKVVTGLVKQLDSAAEVTIDLVSKRVLILSGQPEAPFRQLLADEGYPAN